MTTRRRREPLYVEIAEELKEAILKGDYVDAEKLPSETTLAEEMGVSRTTIREAEGILERDGLVNRIHGVGTLITRSSIPVKGGMERLRSFTEIIKSLDMKPGTSYRNFHWEQADTKLANKLEIETKTPVAIIERVRTGDGQPMMFTVDKMPISVVGEDFAIKNMGESLFVYLREIRGIELAYSELIVRATAVDRDIAHRLDLKPEAPVLTAEETYYNKTGTPVIYCINIYRTDRYHFRIVGRAD